MEVRCEVCEGEKYVRLDEFSENNPNGLIGEGDCPYCDGKGYTG